MDRSVHGDIRHLESINCGTATMVNVHGDIRHLEKEQAHFRGPGGVHGDIRHLESYYQRHHRT